MLYGMSGVEFIELAFELAAADNLKQPETTLLQGGKDVWS